MRIALAAVAYVALCAVWTGVYFAYYRLRYPAGFARVWPQTIEVLKSRDALAANVYKFLTKPLVDVLYVLGGVIGIVAEYVDEPWMTPFFPNAWRGKD